MCYKFRCILMQVVYYKSRYYDAGGVLQIQMYYDAGGVRQDVFHLSS